jgi:hypothetical protein
LERSKGIMGDFLFVLQLFGLALFLDRYRLGVGRFDPRGAELALVVLPGEIGGNARDADQARGEQLELQTQVHVGAFCELLKPRQNVSSAEAAR